MQVKPHPCFTPSDAATRRLWPGALQVSCIVCLLALLTPCPEAYAEEPTRHLALLVGISHYRKDGPAPWPDLHTEMDLKLVSEALRDSFEFPSNDMKILRDGEATTAGIIKAFEEHLINKARPGAHVVFHFSGHGQQVLDDNGTPDELDGLDESLVTYDARNTSSLAGAQVNLRDDKLGELLARLRARMLEGGKFRGSILVLLDSCFSGTATRGNQIIERGRSYDGPPPITNPAALADSPSGLLFVDSTDLDGYVVLSAARSDQRALDENMGLFSKSVAAALREAGPETTYRALAERVSYEVSTEVLTRFLRIQQPQAEGALDRVIFGGTAHRGKPYVVVKSSTGRELTLPTGQLQGATEGSVYGIFPAGAIITGSSPLLAEAVITKVSAFSSTALLLSAVAPTRLEAARAVEQKHCYGSDRLQVFVEGPDERRAALLPILDHLDVCTTQGVTPANYDVLLRAGGDELGLWLPDACLGRPVCPPLRKLQDDEEGRAQLPEALRGLWRWRMLQRLRGGDPNLQVAVRMVPVKPIPDSQEYTSCDQPQRVGSSTLHPREAYRLELTNRSNKPLYFNVIELTPEGRIGPIIPNPRLTLKGDDWRLPPGNKPLCFRFPYKAGRMPGRYLLKVIATQEPVDFSPLLDVSVRSARGARAVLADIPSAHNPLGRLLLAIGTAQRGNESRPVAQSTFTTADLIYDLVSP